MDFLLGRTGLSRPLSTLRHLHLARVGGRTWWAHLKFTPINIELTIHKKEIEELMNVRGIGEKNFLKLKPQLAIGPAKADHEQQPR